MLATRSLPTGSLSFDNGAYNPDATMKPVEEDEDDWSLPANVPLL